MKLLKLLMVLVTIVQSILSDGSPRETVNEGVSGLSQSIGILPLSSAFFITVQAKQVFAEETESNSSRPVN